MSFGRHMPSRERMRELIDQEPDDCVIGAGCDTLTSLIARIRANAVQTPEPDEPLAIIEAVKSETRLQVIADVQRAVRLYPEWCGGWGLYANMNVATVAANECADMLDSLPLDLPDDDDDAALLIARAIQRTKEHDD